MRFHSGKGVQALKRQPNVTPREFEFPVLSEALCNLQPLGDASVAFLYPAPLSFRISRLEGDIRGPLKMLLGDQPGECFAMRKDDHLARVLKQRIQQR